MSAEVPQVVRTSQSEGYTEDSENTPESFTGASSQAEEQIDTTLGEEKGGSVPTGETPVATQPESEFIAPGASPSERILRRLADKFHDRADRIEAKNFQDAVYATYEPNLQKTAEREQGEQAAAKEAARDARRQEREVNSAERKEAVRNVLRGIGSMAKRAYNRTKEIAGAAAFGVGVVGSIAAEATGNKLGRAKDAVAEKAGEVRKSFAEKRQEYKDNRDEARANKAERRAAEREARRDRMDQRAQDRVARRVARSIERSQKRDARKAERDAKRAPKREARERYKQEQRAWIEASKQKTAEKRAERREKWQGRREAASDNMAEFRDKAQARAHLIGNASLRAYQRTAAAAKGAKSGAVEGWRSI